MPTYRPTRFGLCCAVLAWGLVPDRVSGGEAATDLESRVKAAYLLNFLNFVEYPEVPDAPGKAHTICVLGEDPITPALEEGARIQTAKGRLMRIRPISATNQAAGCHILFLAQANRRHLRSAIEPIQNSPILTVSEQAEFLNVGGMVLLYLDADRLQFEINAEATRRAGLHISSKLLVLSRNAR